MSSLIRRQLLSTSGLRSVNKSSSTFPTSIRQLSSKRSPSSSSLPLLLASLTGAAVLSTLIYTRSSLSDPVLCEAAPQSPKTAAVNSKQIDLADASIPLRDRMVAHIQALQQSITTQLETLEPSARFHSSYYLRDNSKGFGDSRVLQDGVTFEKAGCNISVIKSTLSVAAVKQMRAERFDWWDGVSELPYFVAGCSLVVHPRNPHAPTVHFNYRYFEIQDPQDPDGPPKAWWFGGGTDLTPSYLYDEDVKHFHSTYKKACDAHDASYYPRFKKWCDEYFRIPHRGESRGVGGIFFDDLADRSPEAIFSFVRDTSNSFLPAYFPIVATRAQQSFTEAEKAWQQLRRGRYVEFNLVYDRGTKFGLAMKEPRTESILMSLPLTARWEYEPKVGTLEGTEENRLLEILRKPVEWV